jgi:hypothetical protein
MRVFDKQPYKTCLTKNPTLKGMRLLATGKTFMLKRFDLTIRHLVMRLTIALTILFSLNVSAKAFTQKVTIPDRQLSTI